MNESHPANAIRPSGHLCLVPGGKLAVIVLQEWWGLNDQIRGVCRDVQALGHTAFAPDLYKGRSTLDEAEANHLMEGLDWIGACDDDIAASVRFLRASHHKIAVMGFCMGGALAMIAGARISDIDGVISYYGIPPLDAADPANLRAPFMGHFADRDEWITPALVDETERRLPTSPKEPSIYRYAADHAFANETGTAFDSAAAALAWQRTADFLEVIAR